MKNKLIAFMLVLILSLSCFTMPVTATQGYEESDLSYISHKLPQGMFVFDSYYFNDCNCPQIVVNEETESFKVIGENYIYDYDMITDEGETLENYNPDSYSLKCKFVKDNELYLLSYYNVYGAVRRQYSEVKVYDINTGELITSKVFDNMRYTAIGVDAQDRIYMSGKSVTTDDEAPVSLQLMDSEFNLLSETTANSDIYSFVGFDEETGNFYTTAYYNYRSWGYDHAMNMVSIGNVDENNNIVYSNAMIDMVSQIGYNDRGGQVELFDGKYLAVDATVYQTYLLYDVSDFTVDSESINRVMTIARRYDNFDNTQCIGTRSVYLEDTNTVLAASEDNTITEYNPETGEELGSFNTNYNIFAFYEYKDGILLFEKDGEDYYYSIIRLTRPDSITVDRDNVEIGVGDTVKINATVEGIYSQKFIWKSEDSTIASVNSNGEIFGWSEGSTNITVSSATLPPVTIKVTVTKSATLDQAPLDINKNIITRKDNQSENYYTVYADTVKSYITENYDGTFTLVNACGDAVYVDIYNSDFSECIASEIISYPLSIFGGYHSSDKYNFLIFGDTNKEQSDQCEVIRVQKYSKDWKLLDTASLFGENTYIPFDAGSLRMEDAGNLLYVHTCHEMYDDGDGVHHQANMTFTVDMESCEVTQVNSLVSNLAYSGYVSHSFNQFVLSDGENVYRVDHGDGAPRGISIVKTAVGEDITNITYAVPMTFEGNLGENATGASIGGAELSTDSVIIAGNISDGDLSWKAVRDIFVSITDKELTEAVTVYLTDYDKSGNITTQTPHLVKLGDDRFMVLWEEYDTSAYKTVCTKMVTIDSFGNKTSEIVEVPFALSDCAPIYATDNTVKWFVSDGKTTALYSINPYRLDEISFMLGDVTLDGDVNIKDATAIQKYVASLTSLEDLALVAADVDSDGQITVKDATKIQKYIAGLVDIS